jgi:hypothetical protein
VAADARPCPPVPPQNGKEAITGSSPREGSPKAPEIGAFPVQADCTSSSTQGHGAAHGAPREIKPAPCPFWTAPIAVSRFEGKNGHIRNGSATARYISSAPSPARVGGRAASRVLAYAMHERDRRRDVIPDDPLLDPVGEPPRVELVMKAAVAVVVELGQPIVAWGDMGGPPVAALPALRFAATREPRPTPDRSRLQSRRRRAASP